MYESQVQSKKYRQLDQTLGAYYGLDSLYEQLNSKHFKATYAGKPTKRYAKILAKVRVGERVTREQLERAKKPK